MLFASFNGALAKDISAGRQICGVQDPSGGEIASRLRALTSMLGYREDASTVAL
jgi:hypothetical protein